MQRHFRTAPCSGRCGRHSKSVPLLEGTRYTVVDPLAQIADDCQGRVADVQGVCEVSDEEPPRLVALRRSKPNGKREDLASTVHCCRQKDDTFECRGPVRSIQGDDSGTMGPGTGTRAGAEEGHLESAFGHHDLGDGSPVLFFECFEQTGQHVE